MGVVLGLGSAGPQKLLPNNQTTFLTPVLIINSKNLCWLFSFVNMLENPHFTSLVKSGQVLCIYMEN